MTNRLRLRELIVLAVGAVGMESRSVAGTIDQQQLVALVNTGSETNVSQSFTPTLNSIDYAEFYSSTASATLQLKLYDGDGTGGTLLGQSASDAIGSSGYGVVHFDLLSSVTLTPGNTYTLLVLDSTGTIQGALDSANPYAGGELFFGSSGIAPADAVFTEGTSDSSTPEPSSFLLLAFAGLGLRYYQFVIDPSGRK